MRLPFLVLAVASLAVIGCDRTADRPRSVQIGDVMPTVLFPPKGEFVSRSGGADALQLVFQSPLPPDQIAAYYRQTLVTGKWRLVSDTKDSTGTVALYAEQDGPPLWVRVEPAGGGTRIELSGASSALDTAFAAKARRAHDTTNTLMPR